MTKKERERERVMDAKRKKQKQKQKQRERKNVKVNGRIEEVTRRQMKNEIKRKTRLKEKRD